MGSREDTLLVANGAPRSLAAFATAASLRPLLDPPGVAPTLAWSWLAGSPAELLRRQATHPADVLVLELAPLEPALCIVMHELHALHPNAVALVIGETDDVASLARALGWGLRGAMPLLRAASDLPRAVATIAAGQMWFSRPLASALLASRLGTQAEPVQAKAGDAWRQLPTLTERELAVMHEALQGRTNKEIARGLAISEQTVKIHMQNIFHKLRVHRRIDLLLLHGVATPHRS